MPYPWSHSIRRLWNRQAPLPEGYIVDEGSSIQPLSHGLVGHVFGMIALDRRMRSVALPHTSTLVCLFKRLLVKKTRSSPDVDLVYTAESLLALKIHVWCRVECLPASWNKGRLSGVWYSTRREGLFPRMRRKFG